MQVKLRGNRVAIEKIKKQSAPKTGQTFLHIPESEEYLGVIKYVGPIASQDLTPGQKVYFGTNFQTVRMDGTDLCVMEDSQVYAITE